MYLSLSAVLIEIHVPFVDFSSIMQKPSVSEYSINACLVEILYYLSERTMSLLSDLPILKVGSCWSGLKGYSKGALVAPKSLVTFNFIEGAPLISSNDIVSFIFFTGRPSIDSYESRLSVIAGIFIETTLYSNGIELTPNVITESLSIANPVLGGIFILVGVIIPQS